jgi:L-ascorbate metabolism protein UlaG (beta-lactamase superfamily)
MKKIAFLLIISIILLAFTPILNSDSVGSDFFKVTPVSHATMVIDWDGTIIYVDPVGGAALFSEQPTPDIILITDIHGDHLDLETIVGINTSKTTIIAPEAVSEKLIGDHKFQIETLDNGEISTQKEIKIEAIPMYNLREEAKKFHSKGRGNGYVIEKNKKRVYISGDTEDIPEMRALKNIDAAFVCMNLPYTMTVTSAADAVLEFKPKTIYPYHYRGTEGLSDVEEFKTLVEKGDRNIEVVQLDWYPKK